MATLLYFQDIGPNLTKQRFRRNRARHQVFFKSAMGKMTGGSVGTFHVFGRKLGLLSYMHQICTFEGGPLFSDLLSN